MKMRNHCLIDINVETEKEFQGIQILYLVIL